MKRVVLVLAVLVATNTRASADSVRLNQTSVQGDAITFTSIMETAWSFSVWTNAGNTLEGLAITSEGPETFSFTQVQEIERRISAAGTDLAGGNDRSETFSITAAVPEPGSILLLGTCLVGVCGAIRRKLKTRA